MYQIIYIKLIGIVACMWWVITNQARPLIINDRKKNLN